MKIDGMVTRLFKINRLCRVRYRSIPIILISQSSSPQYLWRLLFWRSTFDIEYVLSIFVNQLMTPMNQNYVWPNLVSKWNSLNTFSAFFSFQLKPIKCVYATVGFLASSERLFYVIKISKHCSLTSFSFSILYKLKFVSYFFYRSWHVCTRCKATLLGGVDKRLLCLHVRLIFIVFSTGINNLYRLDTLTSLLIVVAHYLEMTGPILLHTGPLCSYL